MAMLGCLFVQTLGGCGILIHRTGAHVPHARIATQLPVWRLTSARHTFRQTSSTPRRHGGLPGLLQRWQSQLACWCGQCLSA